jgi:hypothetical protein
MKFPKLSLLAAASVLSLSLPGCEIGLLIAAATDEPTNDYPDEYDYEEDDFTSESLALQVSDAEMRGSIGPAESFVAAPAGEAYAGDGWASIVLTSYDLDVPAMSGFSLSGDLQALFTPGSRIDLGGSNSNFGCAGDGFSYETFGEGGELVVEESEKPGMVTISFSVEYEGGDQVEGSFDLAVPPP